MSTETTSSPAGRMSKEDRREQILDAAAHVIASVGLAGASTDVIAREAGVSQPYVVRTFGGKQPLVEAVFSRMRDRLVGAFADAPVAGSPQECLGEAYVRLVRDRDTLLTLMHAFAASGDPRIGDITRDCMRQVFEIVRGRFGDDVAAAGFVAQGMLLNVLLAMDAENHPELSVLVNASAALVPEVQP